MQSLPTHFRILLSNIEPSAERKGLAKDLPGDLRDWLQDHDLETKWPHTRLSGSYARSTAVLQIHDVDVLLFLPSSWYEETPNTAVLRIKGILEDYPGAWVEIRTQRRSIRLHFVDHDLYLDIVPSVLENGYPSALWVPDRPQREWISSDPLGWAERLSGLNQDNSGKVVQLVKLIKAWRDEQMKQLVPSSYVLEVMIVKAIEDGRITLENRSWPDILEQLFDLWWDEYSDLRDEEGAVPELDDEHLDTENSTPWERPQFEAFMRRVDDARKVIHRATAAKPADEAAEEWARVFGQHWPDDDEVKAFARAEARERQPGRAVVGGTGKVVGATAPAVVSAATRFHGGRRASMEPWVPQRDRPLQQIAPMRRTFSGFSWTPNRQGGLTWRGTLQPTPESPTYRVRIVHNTGQSPRVYVDSHWLDPACRHIYRNNSTLCLYWPKEWWWTPGESLPDTIVAWTALWLYFYELWQVTGEWLAPSSPHGVGPRDLSKT